MNVGDLLSIRIPGQVAFLSIFHVIGGVALGFTLRGWVDNPTRENLFGRIFFLIWGGMFGCMPLTFGFESPSTLPIQLMVLLGAIAVPFFWRERLREMASDQNILMVGGGGIFFLVGLVAGTALVREREWVPAVLFGGLFTLIGGGIFFGGLRNLVRGTSDDE